MTDLRVVDMRDLDPILRKAEPAPALARQLELLGAIVSAATARPGGKTWTTPIRCPTRPRRRPCTGRLAVTCHDVPSEIRWQCVTCGKEGAIVGWRPGAGGRPSRGRNQGRRRACRGGLIVRDVLDALGQVLAERGPASLAELRAVAGDTVDAYNRRPQAELGGLSPGQVQRFLDADWEDRDGAIAIADDLSHDELAGAQLLVNARTFLEAVAGDGGVRTTTAGNLNRAFVGRMLEGLVWPEGFLENVRRWNKVINEDDVRPLHVLRILLYQARLLRRWKGTFRVTKHAESLLGEERAGELYAVLFRIHFRRFNLAYLDMVAETYEFQHTIGLLALPLRTVGRGLASAGGSGREPGTPGRPPGPAAARVPGPAGDPGRDPSPPTAGGLRPGRGADGRNQ